MQKQFFSLLLFGAITFSTTNTNAQENAIKIGAPFLTITPDARAAGYGDQGVATSADNNSQYWNPAKFVTSDYYTGISYTNTPWLKNVADGINLHYLSGFYKFKDKQTISASLRYFSLGDISFRDKDGNLTNTFKPNEFAIDVAYARMLSENLSTSITFRYLRSDLTGSSSVPDLSMDLKAASSFAADIAVYYVKKLDTKEIALGASISNIGTKISYSNIGDKSFIPTNLRLGARYTFAIGAKNKFSILAETAKLLVPTPNIVTDSNGNTYDKNADKTVLDGIFGSFSDAPGGFSEEMKEFVYSLGVECQIQDLVSLRTGYFHESEMKGNRKYITAGFGLKYKFASFDFAYLFPTSSSGSNPFENTLRFAVGFQLTK